MSKENENLNKAENSAVNIADVMAMLPSDDKMEELIRSRSQLYTSYSVKDKEGKYRSVVDIDSVIGLMRELLGN
jgi:Na+-transporting NADH:ubiquinone oxidoreductase subunit NqrC